MTEAPRRYVGGPRDQQITFQSEPWLSVNGNPVANTDVDRFLKTYTDCRYSGLYELVELPVTGVNIYKWRVKVQ